MDVLVPAIVLLMALSASLVGASIAVVINRGLIWTSEQTAAAGRDSFLYVMRPLLEWIPIPPSIGRRWNTEDNQRRLAHARTSWTNEHFTSFRWLALWLSCTLAVAVAVGRDWDLFGQFLGLLILTVGLFGPQVWLSWLVERRQYEIDLALPNLLDRLALGMEAGLGFELALKRTATNLTGLLGEDVRRLVRQLERGSPLGEALNDLADRSPSQDLRAFVAAVKQSERLGTSLAQALRVQTDLLRARRRRRAEEASRRLPILIVFPLVFFFLPALLIIYLAPPVLHLFLMR